MAKLPSLSARITRTGLLLIATVFLVLAVISSTVVWKTYHQQMMDSNQVLASSIAKALEEHLNQTKELLKTWTKILYSPRVPLDRQRYLDWIMNDNSRFLRLHFFDSTGKLLQTSPYQTDMIGLDYSGQDFFQKTINLQGPYWSSIILSPIDNEATVAYSMPIQGGLFTAYLSLHRLADFKLPLDMSSQVQLIVTDQNGLYLIHPDVEKVLQREVFPEFDKVKEAMNQDGSAHVKLKTSDGTFYYSGQLVSTNRWGVFLKQPQDAILQPVYDLLLSLGIVALILAVISILISYLFFRRAFTPLEDIVSHMSELGSGNKSVQLESQKFAEFATITAQFNQMSEQISIRQKALQTKNKELEDLLYISSHDLRTPLINIEGFSRELEDLVDYLKSQVPEGSSCTKTILQDMPDSLKFIRNSTQRMDQLIKGLLRIGRLNRSELIINNVDMMVLLEKIRAYMEFQMRKSEARLLVESIPNILGDASELQQIFTNLIENALKYANPKSPPIVQIRSHIEGNMVEIQVQDNGIGLNAISQKRIFDIFYRVGDLTHVTGEGLGLTIVQRLLERHQGMIRVESTPGMGSTFIVKLPLAPST